MDHEEIKAKILDNIKKEPGPLETECWIWARGKNSQGYGLIWIRDSSQRKVHRISYKIFVGPIPEGLHILHLCHRPACCCPEHLYAGTHQDNMDDKVAAGRATALRGSQNGCAILNEKEVAWIKFWLSQDYPQYIIASRYGVTDTAIYEIKRENSWRHVPIEDPEDCPPEFYPSEARWPLYPVSEDFVRRA